MSERDRLDAADPAVNPADEAASEPTDRDSVRRPLIRATLKPQEGVPPPPRQAPVFTMHQQPRGGAGSGRGNGYGNGHPNGQPNQVNGNRAARPARRNERNGNRLNAAPRRGKGRPR